MGLEVESSSARAEMRRSDLARALGLQDSAGQLEAGRDEAFHCVEEVRTDNMRREARPTNVLRVGQIGVMNGANDGMDAFGPESWNIVVHAGRVAGDRVSDERESEKEMSQEIAQNRQLSRVELFIVLRASLTVRQRDRRRYQALGSVLTRPPHLDRTSRPDHQDP